MAKESWVQRMSNEVRRNSGELVAKASQKALVAFDAVERLEQALVAAGQILQDLRTELSGYVPSRPKDSAPSRSKAIPPSGTGQEVSSAAPSKPQAAKPQRRKRSRGFAVKRGQKHRHGH